jgi:hypothetical protein
MMCDAYFRAPPPVEHTITDESSSRSLTLCTMFRNDIMRRVSNRMKWLAVPVD